MNIANPSVDICAYEMDADGVAFVPWHSLSEKIMPP